MTRTRRFRFVGLSVLMLGAAASGACGGSSAGGSATGGNGGTAGSDAGGSSGTSGTSGASGAAGAGGTGAVAGAGGSGGSAGSGGSGGQSTLGRLSAGLAHTCVVTNQGTLVCWGANNRGQIGNNTTVEQPTPVTVGSKTDWKSVSAGAGYTCALDASGQRYCWGYDSTGQLGDGGQTGTHTPVSMDGGWQKISAGPTHACGIKSDGSLWCWGQNNFQQTAPTTQQQIASPTPLLVGKTFSDASAGLLETCAVTKAGALYCWGSANKVAPKQIGSDSNWAQVSIGDYDMCAVKTDGSLWCWGQNDRLQLGLGTNSVSQKTAPTRVGTDNDWLRVQVGPYTSCGLKKSGAVQCWGWNVHGEGGVPITKSTAVLSVPTATALPSGTYVDFDLGGSRVDMMKPAHACALRSDGAVYCWGQGSEGQLGNGYTSDSVLVPRQIGSDQDWSSVTNGWAQKTDGSVWYWDTGGEVYAFELSSPYSTPFPLLTPTSVASATTEGFGSGTCLVKNDGTLWCEQTPDLQNGVYVSPRQLVQVGTASYWSSVARGDGFQCSIDTSGALSCWGDNGSGELGVGDENNRSDPTPVSGGGTWKKVAAGHTHACAIKSDGTLWCWGANSYGEVGNGSVGGGPDVVSPTQVGSASDWTNVVCGEFHSCGLRASGTVYCWGQGSEGQLGNGGNYDSSTPVGIGLDVYTYLGTAQYQHTCAVRQDGALFCWGDGSYGQLGNQMSPSLSNMPVQVKGAGNWKAVAAGQSYTLGLKTDGTLWCWGDNREGACGKPVTWRDTPEQVTLP